MKIAFQYKIKTVNPVIISSRRGDANMVNTKSYITGNTILGVFASLYIKNEGLKDAHKDEEFYNWFLKGDLIFTNAYIVDYEDGVYFPNPHSIREEKYADGSACDLMFKDDDLNKPMKSVEAFIRMEDFTVYDKSVGTSISFHYLQEDKADNKIFNYESINAGQIFEGNIIGSKAQIDSFKEYFSSKLISHIGLSKNSQYGKSEIKLVTEDIYNYKQEIKTPVESDDEKSVMTLLSDAIIYNDNGFPTSDVEDLEKLLGVKFESAFIKKGRVEQFVGVWKLKNQSETVFTAGSCFKFNGRLPDDYIEMQINGIGEKTNEGFGRVVFGWQDEMVKYSKEAEMETHNRPEGDPPDLVKRIMEGVRKDELKNKVISKAMGDAHSFNNNIPTRSLCGKLQYLVGDADDFKDNFVKVMENEHARAQLYRCRNDNKRLSEHLESDELIDINNLLGVDYFGSNLKGDANLKKEMRRLYLKTFLNFMRKDDRR